VLDKNNHGDFRIVSVPETGKPGVILKIRILRLPPLAADDLNSSRLTADIQARNGGIMSRSPAVDAFPHSLADSDGMFGADGELHFRPLQVGFGGTFRAQDQMRSSEV